MDQKPGPCFTEEYGLFYLWKPELQADKVQLAGEFKSESEMQKRSFAIFGAPAVRRAAL
jgi:hypothetical protein